MRVVSEDATANGPATAYQMAEMIMNRAQNGLMVGSNTNHGGGWYMVLTFIA